MSAPVESRLTLLELQDELVEANQEAQRTATKRAGAASNASASNASVTDAGDSPSTLPCARD